MRVGMLRKVFYTEGDLEKTRTIQLAHNERIVAVIPSPWPHTYDVFVGEELELSRTLDEVHRALRPTVTTHNPILRERKGGNPFKLWSRRNR